MTRNWISGASLTDHETCSRATQPHYGSGDLLFKILCPIIFQVKPSPPPWPRILRVITYHDQSPSYRSRVQGHPRHPRGRRYLCADAYRVAGASLRARESPPTPRGRTRRPLVRGLAWLDADVARLSAD